MNCEVKRLTLPGAAPAVRMPGALPPPAPLSCGAPPPRARRDPRGAASLHFPAADTENPCGLASDGAFRDSPELSRTTTGRAPPSEREALWLRKS